ncbi:MAG: diguanylate cyclase domain-containing protein [Casimicrobiaceae bacterium]
MLPSDRRRSATLSPAPPASRTDPRVGGNLQLTRAATPAFLAGLVIAIPACTVMAGWLLRDSRLVHFTFGATIVLDTALGFCLMAVALMAGSLPPVWQRRVRASAGAVMATIAVLVLGEYVSGHASGIDWPALHRWYIDANPYPGRMSAPTAVAFLLSGVALVVMDRVRGRWAEVLVQALTTSIVAVGGIGIAGHVLKLPLVYHHYVFGQMGIMTATGFIVAGTGLWLSWRHQPWYRSRVLMRRDEQRIVINGASILGATLFLLVFAMFTIVQHFIETMAVESLSQRLQSHIDMVGVNLDLRTARAALIANRPLLNEQLATLNAHPDDVDARTKVARGGASFLSDGITGLAIASPQGTVWMSAGTFASEPRVALPILGDVPASLLWDHGLVLRVQIPMLRNGSTVGTMTAEQRLVALTAVLQSKNMLATVETDLCARRKSQLECFSPHLREATFATAYTPALPMAHALAGAVGVLTALDYRGESVIAAYGPIGSTGLGLVDKVDTDELYAPLRALLYITAVVAILAFGAGLAFLRRNVAPLARELARGKARLQLALAASHLALWEWDAKSDQVSLSEEWEAMLGRSARATAMPLRNLVMLLPPEEQPAVEEHLRGVLAGATALYDIEHRIRAQDGHWKWIRSRGNVVERNREGRAVRLTGIVSDITARKTRDLKVAHLANHDALTDLPNRNLFDDRLSRAIERSRRNQSLMALMYLDIDKFKQVNDTLGHDVGDALLKQFAARLCVSVRATDTVARLGGDEFAVIVETLRDRDDGCHLADKIVAAMRTPFMLGSHTLDVTTSVGLAFLAGERGIDETRLRKMADEALYNAKAAGRNQVAVAAAATMDQGSSAAPAGQTGGMDEPP